MEEEIHKPFENQHRILKHLATWGEMFNQGYLDNVLRKGSVISFNINPIEWEDDVIKHDKYRYYEYKISKTNKSTYHPDPLQRDVELLALAPNSWSSNSSNFIP